MATDSKEKKPTKSKVSEIDSKEIFQRERSDTTNWNKDDSKLNKFIQNKS